jgi:hypothetical protein
MAAVSTSWARRLWAGDTGDAMSAGTGAGAAPEGAWVFFGLVWF